MKHKTDKVFTINDISRIASLAPFIDDDSVPSSTVPPKMLLNWFRQFDEHSLHRSRKAAAARILQATYAAIYLAQSRIIALSVKINTDDVDWFPGLLKTFARSGHGFL